MTKCQRKRRLVRLIRKLAKAGLISSLLSITQPLPLPTCKAVLSPGAAPVVPDSKVPEKAPLMLPNWLPEMQHTGRWGMACAELKCTSKVQAVDAKQLFAPYKLPELQSLPSET